MSVETVKERLGLEKWIEEKRPEKVVKKPPVGVMIRRRPTAKELGEFLRERERKIKEELERLTKTYSIKPFEPRYIAYALATNKRLELIPLGWFEDAPLAHKYRVEGGKRIAKELKEKRMRIRERIEELKEKYRSPKISPEEKEKIKEKIEELEKELKEMPKYVITRVLTYEKMEKLGAPELRKPELVFAPEEKLSKYLASPEEMKRMEEEWRRKQEELRKKRLRQTILWYLVAVPVVISALVRFRR